MFITWNVLLTPFNLYNNDNNKLPLLPKKIGGNFNCSQQTSKLTSLEGCPKYIGGYFDCRSNSLKSLEGGPEYVGGRFDCRWNDIGWDDVNRLYKIVLYANGTFTISNKKLSK